MSDIPNKLGFCCLPVLPTIFSDELSYKEMLCKMKDYINQMIDALKQQDEDIANIQKQIDKVDPSKYIQTSGGTLTGPLFFIDNAHVLKNENGTITLSGTGLMNLHGGGIVTIDTPESIAIIADKHVDITGSTGVEILTGENGTVNIEGGGVSITGDINVHGPMIFDQNSVVENADGTFTVQSNNPVVLKGGQTVAVNATGGIELRSGGTALITGTDGVSILDKSSAGVAVYEGNTAIAGNIEINGYTTFRNVDVDMLNAKTKVAEPVEDENPATKKYVDAHGGVTCGYISVSVDDSKTTVDLHSESLIPKGELGGYYVDNAGNLWHATQVVADGFKLENQKINVLANAKFVRITGSTSVKNINVIDTGSSIYQANTNVSVHGVTDVDIIAGQGTVDIEGPIVDIHASHRVNIDTGGGGSVVIGGAKSAVDMGNAVSVIVPTPVKDSEPATKLYVDQHAGGGTAMKQFNTDNGIPMLPISDIPPSGRAKFNVSFTVGTTDNTQPTTLIATGQIEVSDRSIVDIRVLEIGYLQDTSTVECRWLDSGLVTMTTDGIQFDYPILDGYTGWYAKIA